MKCGCWWRPVKQQEGPDEAALWVPARGGRAVPLLYQPPACLQHQPDRRRSRCAPWVPLVLALMADRSADGLPCTAELGFQLQMPTQKMIQNAPDPDPHNYDSTFGGSTVLILKNKTKQNKKLTISLCLFGDLLINWYPHFWKGREVP